MFNPDYVFERRMRRYELTEDVNDCRTVYHDPETLVPPEGQEDDVNFEVRQ